MTSTITTARPESAAGRTTLVALAARETHRFAVNPVFPFAVVMTAWTTWDNRKAPVTGVTPATLPARTAALCAVAVAPSGCGVLTLFAFRHFHPAGARVYGAFSPPAQVAVLAGQIVIPSPGGPLPGVAPGRWVRFPGAALVLSLVIYGWVNVATSGSLPHPDPAAFTALRLFSPFAFFTYMNNATDVTTWRGSPWFFTGRQLALCAIAVLAALLRGADGRVRFRVTRTLQIVLVLAAILLVLAAVGGFPHAVHA